MCHIVIAGLRRSLLLGFLTIAAGAAYAQQQMVIFGDSLSDTGNKHAARGILNTPPYDGLNPLGVPSDPYAKGGKHFSNGQVWIEHVAAAIGAGGDARPVSGSNGTAGNYAWGGARAVPPAQADGNRHLAEQVYSYLADVNYHVSPDTLHVIFIGGNDMVDALLMLSADPRSFPAAVNRVASTALAVQAGVQALLNAGARRFLVLNSPNVGLIPAIPPDGKPITSCFSYLYNEGFMPPGCPTIPGLPISLRAVTNGLSAMEGVEVTTVDVFEFISGIAAYPQAFGLKNVTSMCVMPMEPPYACKRPNEYLFWDGIHPTRAVHAMLATRVLNELDE